MHNFHKLNIDSNRHTKNIIIVKIVVEDASLCGKNMRYAHIAEICENAATCEIGLWGNRKFA